MRLGVIDVGSNTVHLLVVDAHPGASPVPYHSQRSVLRLMRYVDADGAITDEGVQQIVEAVREMVATVAEIGVDDLITTATSAIREAANGETVLATIEREAGVPLDVLSGEDEARITMLAVRRWLGWSAGEILLFDIGGGSFELAQGADEYPDVQVSLPLGAGRSTIHFLAEDPPPREAVRASAHTHEPSSPESEINCSTTDPNRSAWWVRRRRFDPSRDSSAAPRTQRPETSPRFTTSA